MDFHDLILFYEEFEFIEEFEFHEEFEFIDWTVPDTEKSLWGKKKGNEWI